MTYIFFKALLIGYSGAVMPGSLLTYTINQSLRKGWIAGLMIVIGHAILELVLITLLFLGIQEFLGSVLVSMVIGFFGGTLLTLFGLRTIREIVKKRHKIDLEKSEENTMGKLGMIPAGAVVSFSNPMWTIWWVGIGLGLLNEAYILFGIWGIVVFTVGHLLADVSWYLFVSVLIDRTRKFISQKVYNVMGTVLGIAMIGFGIYFIVQAIGFLQQILT